MERAERARKDQYQRQKTGRLVPCPGQAHDPDIAGNIDNCLTCAPRWGQVEELAPVDILEAQQKRQDIAAGDLTDPQLEFMAELEKAGTVTLVEVVKKTRAASTYYLVYRWT